MTALHATLSGPDTAHLWLLIHGYGDGSYVWCELVEHFAGTHRFAAIDLPGHGRSYSRGDAAYTTEATLDDVVATVNAFGVGRFSVIGHSWGGIIGLHLAARFPERTAGLVVVDCDSGRNEESARYLRRELSESLGKFGTVGEYAHWFAQRRPLASASTARKVAAAAMRALPDGTLERALDPALVESDLGDQASLGSLLGRVQAEVLVIRGAVSGTVSAASAQAMTNQLRNARLHTVPRAGHSVMIDNPVAFNGAVGPFLERIAAREGHQSMERLCSWR